MIPAATPRSPIRVLGELSYRHRPVNRFTVSRRTQARISFPKKFIPSPTNQLCSNTTLRHRKISQSHFSSRPFLDEFQKSLSKFQNYESLSDDKKVNVFFNEIINNLLNYFQLSEHSDLEFSEKCEIFEQLTQEINRNDPNFPIFPFSKISSNEELLAQITRFISLPSSSPQV